MKSLKRKNKNSHKRIIFKFIIIPLLILLIYLSIIFNNLIFLNSFYNIVYHKFKSDNFLRDKNINCDKYDPIYLFGERFKKKPVILCKSKKSNHICYQTSKYNNNQKIAEIKYGFVCKSENFILDPFKSSLIDLIYKGAFDKVHKGDPILFNGFFNMKCNIQHKIRKYHEFYNTYLESWKYEKINNKIYVNEGDFPELAPGKIILFISRNHDSTNLFHGISEFINALSTIYIFNLNPEKIQIVFLESFLFKDEPLYILYKNIISRGGEPILLRNLKKKYHIVSAFHIPINYDSPLFIKLNIKNGFPNCKYSTQTYNILNKLIDKYLNITEFKDSFVSDGEIFYYPESVTNNNKFNNSFNKTITIQWRKTWPKGRKYQQRLLGNGPELADKLASNLTKNYLVRLVDTASLSIIDQISIMRKTDYLIGVHGAGLSLSIFMPYQSILYEILPKENIKVLLIMSSLSGHKVYSDIIKSELKIINNNQVYFFDSNQFIEKVKNIL